MNKNNVITVRSINIDDTSIGDWQYPTYNTGYVGVFGNEFRYRKRNDSEIQLSGAFEESGSPLGLIIFTLPIGYRPIIEQPVALQDSDGNFFGAGNISVNGEFSISSLLGSAKLIFNIIIPLD